MNDIGDMIIITGPTATGKTRFGVALARAVGGEIISADSRQIYRGMDLGTGKDLAEYGDIPYHMIDIVDAGYRYNLYEYMRDFDQAYRSVVAHGARPLVVGGTGLYVETIAKGIRLPEVPENVELRERLSGYGLAELTEILASMKRLHNTTDVDTAKRAIRAIEIEQYYADHPDKAAARQISADHRQPVIIALEIDRDSRRERISRRLRERLDAGMVDEVRSLIGAGVSPDTLMYYGLEYKYLTLHVLGELSYAEMYISLETAIHQFAKRQMTWFRGMERRGSKLYWLPYDIPAEEFVDKVRNIVENHDKDIDA